MFFEIVWFQFNKIIQSTKLKRLIWILSQLAIGAVEIPDWIYERQRTQFTSMNQPNVLCTDMSKGYILFVQSLMSVFSAFGAFFLRNEIHRNYSLFPSKKHFHFQSIIHELYEFTLWNERAGGEHSSQFTWNTFFH